jgi:hypothetical protein
MYDPNLDAEERLRKIAMQQLMANNKEMATDIKVAPTIDMPAPAVAPPEVPEASMMDQMMQGLANYQGMSTINPIGVQPIQRGGGVMQAIQPQMAAYGTGLNTSGLLDNIGEDEDGSDKLKKMIAKAMAGGA